MKRRYFPIVSPVKMGKLWFKHKDIREGRLLREVRIQPGKRHHQVRRNNTQIKARYFRLATAWNFEKYHSEHRGLKSEFEIV